MILPIFPTLTPMFFVRFDAGLCIIKLLHQVEVLPNGLAGYLDVLEACACVCGLETVASCVYIWVY